MAKKRNQAIGLVICVAGLWACGNQPEPLTEESLWAGIKPAVKEKVDSFFEDPQYSDFKIYDVFITRAAKNAYLKISAVMDKNHFDDRVYPDNYLFYNGRLLFVYTGVAAFFTDRNPSANQIQKVLDSACARNHITNTSPMIANPPRMMLKITPGDSVSTDPDLAEWNLLNDVRVKAGDFVPPKIKANRR